MSILVIILSWFSWEPWRLPSVSSVSLARFPQSSRFALEHWIELDVRLMKDVTERMLAWIPLLKFVEIRKFILRGYRRITTKSHELLHSLARRDLKWDLIWRWSVHTMETTLGSPRTFELGIWKGDVAIILLHTLLSIKQIGIRDIEFKWIRYQCKICRTSPSATRPSFKTSSATKLRSLQSSKVWSPNFIMLVQFTSSLPYALFSPFLMPCMSWSKQPSGLSSHLPKHSRPIKELWTNIFGIDIHTYTDICFRKCITSTIKQGKLDKYEEPCMQNCVDRFMDANTLVLKQLEMMRNTNP